MKSVDELKNYFDHNLAKDIKALDAKRQFIIYKSIAAWILVAILMIVSFVVLAIFLEKSDSKFTPGWIILILTVFPTGGYVAHKQIISNKKFYEDFKSKVIEQIVNFIDPNFHYDNKKYIPVKTFNASKIFGHSPNKYRGDDFVSGNIGSNQTKVSFSEIHAEYKPKKKSQDDKNELRNLFKGLFFVAETDENFEPFFIIPKNAEFLFEKSGFSQDELQLTLTKNEAFNQYYRLYATNAKYALERLNEEILDEITTFTREHKDDVYVSCLKTNLYVAISHQHDLFEPRLYHSLTDFSIIREYFDVMHPALTIVEQINEQISQKNIRKPIFNT